MTPRSVMPYTVVALLLIAQLIVGTAAALDVRAEIDKNPVIVDESFTLTVTANDDLPRNAFRTDPLVSTFIVGATSVDRSTHIVNGQMERQTRWRVTLIARRPGQYEIPSFDLDGTRTAPIVVDVVEPSETTSERGPVFLTTDIDNQSPYLQQQVRYTVRLHLAQTLESGSISPPEVSHADIQQASNDDDRQEIIDGQRYRVITRTYFITPRRSGELTVQGSRFDGQVRDSSSRSFATFSRPQSVTALAPDITLDVQPQPADYDGHWLPSEQVVLSEDWDEDQRFIVGEPINREITLTAQGVRDEQLPDLQVDYPAGLRFYPERTDRDSFSRQGQRFAQARFRGVIIPARAGTFELPAVEVQWWDVEQGQQRTAQIPARTIEIHEPAGGLESPFAQDLDSSSLPSSDMPPLLPVAPTAATPSGLWSTAAWVLLVLWLVTLAIAVGLWRRLTGLQRAHQSQPSQLVPVTSRESLRDLQQACKRNDAAAANAALNRWLRTTQLGVTSPDQLLALYPTDSDLSAGIEGLELSLFSQEKPAWTTGDALWRAIQRLHRNTATANDNALPNLYGE